MVKARVDRHGVSAVDPCALNVLHHAWDDDGFAVAHGVDLAFLAFQVLVNEYRPIRAGLDARREVGTQLPRRLDDLHCASAKNVTRAHQHRVADGLGHLQRLFYSGDGGARRLRHADARHELLEPPPIRRNVYGLRGGAEEWEAPIGPATARD